MKKQEFYLRALGLLLCICSAVLTYAQRPRVQKKEVDIHLSEIEFTIPTYLAAIDSVIVDIQKEEDAEYYKYICLEFAVLKERNAYLYVTAINHFPYYGNKGLAGYIPHRDYIILVENGGKNVTQLNHRGKLKTFTYNPNLPPWVFISMFWHVTIHKKTIRRHLWPNQ